MAAMHEQFTYRNVGASEAAIKQHYDVGNDFYEHFLGPTMAYSAGIWRDPSNTDTLEDAQNRKLDWHIDSSGSDTALRVLEIGCGWGSLVNRLAVRNPRAEVTGLTMSEEQAAHLRSSSNGRAKIKVMPWQSFQSNRQFHSIVSIETIEHFASFELTREERIQAYRDFFEFCARHLVRGGRMTLQMSVWNNVIPGEEKQFDFIKHFFPESCLPHVPDLVAASDGIFHVMRLENTPRDYVYTLREWLRRLEQNQAKLTREYGSELVHHYIENFNIILLGFLNGSLSVARMALKRRGPTVSLAGR
jgi:cyclopropane-fatty-acyl-phospholipid synthase